MITSPKPKTIFAGYIPVIHRGYIDLLSRHQDSLLYLFDTSITGDIDYLRKDIRTLQPAEAIASLAGLGFTVQPLSYTELEALLGDPSGSVTLIDDDISKQLINQCTVKATVTLASPFLRWDRNNTTQTSDITVDETIRDDGGIVPLLYEEASRSTDWWRHVGAAIVDENSIVKSAHNRGIPHEYINSVEGDPRSAARQGTAIENSLFIHAEGDLIAACARDGITTKDKAIYVTTFPCPNCAKLIAASGISTCYFVEGYGALEGERTLRDAGVAIIRIETNPPAEAADRLRPYPHKKS